MGCKTVLLPGNQDSRKNSRGDTGTMCGIAGFASAKPLNESAWLIHQMTDAVAHRGPDDSGFYRDRHVALGHRRLSIIDIASGHQPMSNEAGTLQIVYNGEIFNHAELRPTLERAGHRYATHCDTETIVHAYEEYGPPCLARFRGMFAFAIWDSVCKRLFCARDRLGKKPFYYFWNDNVFVFASEIKAILRHPAVSAECETEALPEYLGFGYLSGERTLFRGIRKLQPGHYLTLDISGESPKLSVPQYWNVPAALPRVKANEDELIRETRRRVEEAVRTRLMSDVPLGMFLSGGVDSSAIAAITKQLTGGPVETFSVGYEEERYSELSYAARVARALGTDHQEVRVSFDDFFTALPQLIWHEDEPITWPSSVSLHFVSRLAAERVKVVLTGEGSDELFAGYERYRWNLLNTRGAAVFGLLPSELRKRVQSFVQHSRLLRSDLRRKLAHTFVAREPRLESLFLDNFYCAFRVDEARRILRQEFTDQAIYGAYREAFDAYPQDSLLARMLYADQKTYLVELLMKQDQMSMSASIESRVPLLDHELVEFSRVIPDSLKIKGGEQKYIFKRAMEDLLPPDIVYRKKMGFPTPLRAWLRDERAQPFYAKLMDRSGWLASVIDLKEVERLLARHIANQEDATDRLWRLLNLQLWGDVFLSGTPFLPVAFAAARKESN
jgi:asparagine synthase (glutamine-hydrolysing)